MSVKDYWQTVCYFKLSDLHKTYFSSQNLKQTVFIILLSNSLADTLPAGYFFWPSRLRSNVVSYVQ